MITINSLSISSINRALTKLSRQICCSNGGGDARPYRVYTALLTQSGDSSISDKVQGDSLDVGVTYTIASNTENADLTVFGALNSNVGTSFVCTTAGILPSIGNISLTYDTAAPVVTVLENTIGNIYFTYESIGTYMAKVPVIAEKKQVVFSNSVAQSDGSNQRFFNVENNSIDGEIYFVSSDGTSRIDGQMTDFCIEIRVYN
jgi:hypothetical protein